MMRRIKKDIKRLENKINNQLNLLEKGFISKDDKDLAFRFKLLEEYDLPSYEKHLKIYTQIIKKNR